ncbi:aconitate hydratase AcnA, partial [Arthrobacter sp. MSA 4-2]|uniref:aconitate hydratase AcnA n=1 Tax=Arthrobacter sp. MSA 4-2 TaxID=2794349 RepID=UPI0018E867BB
AKEQGLWHDPSTEIRFSEYLELDLSTVVPSIAGPKRPQDRVALTESKSQFRKDLANYVHAVDDDALDEALDETFPASDVPAMTAPLVASAASPGRGRPSRAVPVSMTDGREFELDHGAVTIASITSCTNTSNPSVMLAAALLARNAVEKGLSSKPWVKTSVAPGSKVVTDYYDRSGLTPYLEKLGFFLVGYGCATCIGNSGPLEDEISSAISAHDLTVAAVLSGNRNFEGRINPDVKMNYLASPPLVVAYALAGTMDFDFEHDPLGLDADGNGIFLRDIWPSPVEVQAVIDSSIDQEMFTSSYGSIFEGDERWQSLPTPAGDTFAWDPASTYVRRPPYFEGITAVPKPVGDIAEARVLVMLGDSVTTDHISPAGSFKSDTPAGRYLLEHGVQRRDFNSYGSRRGNHEVMIRGTFANIRLRNRLLDGVEGGFTRDFTQTGGPQTYIYDAARNYAVAGTPLVVLAGKEYGSGSSRDWAAKGTALLGVKAVIAESYERIHRSNLIGMGVLPLQFRQGENAAALGLSGTETFSVEGITALNAGSIPDTVRVTAVPEEDGEPVSFDAVVRIDTPGEADYYRHGGILHYVLRQLSAQ